MKRLLLPVLKRSGQNAFILAFVFLEFFFHCVGHKTSFASNNSAELSGCRAPLRELVLERTLGVEWEVKKLGAGDEPSPLDQTIMRGFFPGREEFTVPSEILGNSNFPRLFSFYGRDKSGSFVEHFIPNVVAQHPGWRSVREDKTIHLKRVDGGVVIENFSSLSGSSLVRILDRTLAARGRNGQNLVLRKSSSGWTEISDLDRQIPDAVAEEWRGDDTFVGFEFPMHGGVKSWPEIKDWYRNLWWRLGLISDKNNSLVDSYVSTERDHIHWRTNPMHLPTEERAKTFSGLVGFWGDRNDSAFVRDFDLFRDRVRPDGSVTLNRNDSRVGCALDMMSLNYSLCPLTRSLYARVSAGSDGIHIADRAKDLDPGVDHSVPPAFKRLLMGLRGGVGVAVTNGSEPITVVELEARSTGDTTRGNLETLPLLTPGTNHIDLGALQAHANPAPRGLIDGIPELEARAKELGIPQRLVSEANRELDKKNLRRNKEYRRYIWRNNQILAAYFIPLNDWLSHPIVQRNLSALPAAERQGAVRRYRQALERYKTRMISLDRARKDRNAEYAPDWLPGPKRFADGSNRFFPQGIMNGKDPDLYNRPRSEAELSQYPDAYSYETDPLVLSALEIEMFRFVSESGLSDLLRF